MTTYVMSKEYFLKQMESFVKEGEVIILSSTPQGNISGRTKKNLKQISIGFADDAFKNPDTITDIMQSKPFGLIIIDKKFIPEDTLNRTIEKEGDKDGEE